MLIESAIISHLSGADLTAYAERPDSPPSTFILIQKTGSNRQDFVDRATVAIQSIAPTMLGAAQLNESVKARMLGMPDAVDAVAKVSLNSDYNYTDTARREYRYQAVFDIVYKGE